MRTQLPCEDANGLANVAAMTCLRLIFGEETRFVTHTHTATMTFTAPQAAQLCYVVERYFKNKRECLYGVLTFLFSD